MTTDEPVPDPYTVLGVEPTAGPEHIAAAYRRALRDCHPDTSHPDRDRLARVIAAYRQLRERGTGTGGTRADDEPARRGHRIPVRVHTVHPTETGDTAGTTSPHLRAGPVRRHP
jgi:hypothetical protein